MTAKKNHKTTLTPKQNRFCEEYAIDLNATQAAIRSGYGEKAARAVSSRLLTNVNIQNRIKELQSDLERASGITKLRVINGFAAIAFSNISAFHNTWVQKKDFELIPESEKAAIQEISTKVNRVNSGTKDQPIYTDVEYVKIKLYDRNQALTKIADLLGYNQPSKYDIDIQKMTDEQLDEFTFKLINTAKQD